MRHEVRMAGVVAGLMMAVSLVAPVSAEAGGVVAYFYNQSDSAAPVSATFKGKNTVTVDPVAPGHVSGPVTLPEGYPDPMSSSPQAQKMLKDMGLPIPRLIDISLHSAGGSRKLNLPLHADLLPRGHVRTLIYFMRVKSAGAAPEPEDGAAVAIQDSDFKAATGGKALVAIVNETYAKGLTLDSGHFDVWFRDVNGNVWDEASNTGFSLVSTEQLKPGSYDLLSTAESSLNLQQAKTATPVATLSPATLPSGRIGIYMIRKPGKLEHVLELSPQ